jgi:gamma-glutamylaminecyclotransferase
MQHLVFVYGTLKKGFPNYARYMTSAGFLGIYQTMEKYPLVIFGSRHVPGMLDRPGDGYHIEGELYEVNDECLGSCLVDCLEMRTTAGSVSSPNCRS